MPYVPTPTPSSNAEIDATRAARELLNWKGKIDPKDIYGDEAMKVVDAYWKGTTLTVTNWSVLWRILEDWNFTSGGSRSGIVAGSLKNKKTIQQLLLLFYPP